MGIELPSELTDVAAKAGVQWPQADEEAMRSSAQAWRQAGAKIDTLTKDADGTANNALASVSGATGTAAQAHWQTFVAPDTGHLTSTAKGCTDAADRLDHAADQVGAAKVRIVQHLVTLAKSTDAADAAAAAGHPTALAGLRTAVQGTATSVAQVNHSLTTSIRLDNTPAGQHGQPPAITMQGPQHTHAQPSLLAPLDQDGLVSATGLTGQHGPLGHDGVLGQHGPAGPAGQDGPLGQNGVLGQHGPVTQAGHGLAGHDGVLGQHGPAAGLTTPGALTPDPGSSHGGPQDVLPPLTGQGSSGDQGHGPVDLSGTVAPVAGGTLDGSVVPILPGHPGPGTMGAIDPEHTGPIAVGQIGVAPGHPVFGQDPHGSAPTPPMGTVVQSAAPALATPPTGFTHDTPAFQQAAAPPPHQAAAPPPGNFSAPTPSFGTPVVGGPSAPPPPAMTAAPAGQQAPVNQQAPANQPGRGSADVVGGVDVRRPTQAGAARQAPRSAAVPPGQDGASGLPGGGPAGRPDARRDAVALFLVYLFPIGQLPRASGKPARQLPPPAVETDFAAGLRFEPHDHPESGLIVPEVGATGTPHPGFAAQDPEVAELAEAHDPLGGQHERDWDRRFLVRPAEDRAAEYAWPPGELFPEGGCDAGEPVVLAADTVIDRFGSAEGRVFAEDGTPFARRSLPPDQLVAGYHRYRVSRDLPLWRTLSAAWFGQSGGGVRYRAVYPAADLVAMGYLTDITGTGNGH
jgi:hypothetical protein